MPQSRSFRWWKHFVHLALAAVVLVGPDVARAQGTDASIGGRVATANGAPVGDVIVAVRNTSTGFTSTTRSTDAGQYVFAQLPLGGPYEVTARRVAFDPITEAGYRLTLGSRLRVDFTLAERATTLASR